MLFWQKHNTMNLLFMLFFYFFFYPHTYYRAIINPEAMSDEEIKSFNECFEEAENTIIVSTRDFKRRKNFPIYFNIAIDISNPLCGETYYNLMKFGVEYMEYKFYYDSSKKSFLS